MNIFQNKVVYFLLFSLIHNIFGLKFFFILNGRTMKCLGEYLTDNTLGKIIILNLQPFSLSEHLKKMLESDCLILMEILFIQKKIVII